MSNTFDSLHASLKSAILDDMQIRAKSAKEFCRGEILLGNLVKTAECVASEEEYANHIPPEIFKKYRKDPKSLKSFIGRVLASISEDWVKEEKAKNLAALPKNDLSPEDVEASRRAIRDLKAFSVVGKPPRESLVFLDQEGRFIDSHQVNTLQYLNILGVTGDILDEYVSKMTPVDVVFDPTNPERIVHKEDNPDLVAKIAINRHNPPLWRKYVGEVEASYSGRYKEFMEHFFPDSLDREYVLDWMHYAITDVAETVLCLVGERHTGKNFFVHTILGPLVNPDYLEVAKESMFRDKFNSSMMNKRIVYFDDVALEDEQAIVAFRKWTNKKISYEGKGEDSVTVRNFSSYVVSSNEARRFRISSKERRFSTPRLTSVRLDDFWKNKSREIGKRLVSLEGLKDLAAFGKYLLQRVPKIPADQELKNTYYFQLCDNALRQWEKSVFSFIGQKAREGKSSVSAKDIKGLLKKNDSSVRLPGRETISKLFDDHLVDQGRIRVASVVDSSVGAYEIQIEEEYLDYISQKYGLKNSSGPQEVDFDF